MEFLNTVLGTFFLEKGILHQSSCIDTSQQNGIPKRKNKHLLEVSRELLLTNNVPKYLWGDAILTATYLINRMPSNTLNFQTPLNVFHTLFPISRISTDLPLKIFWCTMFVHNNNNNRGKLDPRARTCVFWGYLPIKRGYKCFDPLTHKIFVTMDVSFFKTQPFFRSHL